MEGKSSSEGSTPPGDDPLADPGLLRRAQRHAALGEPVRLAMVERLLLTDASPGELGAAYGLATNVLAHHLKVLQAAGLVLRVRSEGDARRAYIQLCLDDDEVRYLVDPPPGQGTGSPTRPLGLSLETRPERVLFVCTHNSARSQLAAAAWRQVSRLPVASAGTNPAPHVHPRAVAVGRRNRLRIDSARTARLGEIAAEGDLVVCVCDSAHEQLTTAGRDVIGVPVAGQVHWAVPDPARIDTDEAFETAYTEIAGRVQRLARTLGAQPAGARTH